MHLDPHVSRLVRPVTEYSAPQGSSSFSNEHLSGMDTTRILFALKQGPHSLENHVREFLAITHYSDLPDIILIEIFCDGINQPLQSKLRREGPRSSLAHFMDYALLTVGSLFTVGFAEDERDTASVTEMADAPEGTHKMAVTTTHESRQVTVDCYESSHVSADLPESRHVFADHPESRHVSVDHPVSHHESSHVSADLPESRHVFADLPESRHVSVDHPVSHHESSHVSADLPESRHVFADLPESRHVYVDHPESHHESRHVSADLPESLHLSADLPESLHVSADHPESRHISADLPESCHVSSDLPEPLHVMSTTPEPRPVAVVVLQPSTVLSRETVSKHQRLASSVEDPPLVSARTAGIPKPTHFNSPVPALIPLPEALPMMGIALLRLGCVHQKTA